MVRQLTRSLWTDLNLPHRRSEFQNLFYRPTDAVLHPELGKAFFWAEYFWRFSKPDGFAEGTTHETRTEQLHPSIHSFI